MTQGVALGCISVGPLGRVWCSDWNCKQSLLASPPCGCCHPIRDWSDCNQFPQSRKAVESFAHQQHTAFLWLCIKFRVAFPVCLEVQLLALALVRPSFWSYC